MSVSSVTPLKVLNASAGSGKTYNLVKEYIILLISEKNDLTRFSRIIAMTFTNKAALEMKNRIVKALDELSYPEIYGEKSDRYATELSEELMIDPEEIHIRSRNVLQNILHQYEDFHVMTIDKFNLKLIRSFSRDLDLPNDFEVILNESEVIEQVVDLLLDQLGRVKSEKVNKLVFEYARHNLDEGEKWNFRDQLVDFGKILSKEKDHPIIEKLLKLDFSIERLKELKAIVKSINDSFIQQSKAVYDLYNDLDFNKDLLPGKSATANPIQKLGEYQEIPKEFFTIAFLNKANSEPPKGKVFPQELRMAILNLQETYTGIVAEYFIKKLFLKNFYNMALLQYMALSLETIKKNEQLIRISEFNKLISELVRNEEAPFIYERLGTRFQHFLLDEFQDTSRLQWLNMVPLVHESISNENKNLIVGDPKQSIYRFKNGVAEQFVVLPKIYNPEGDENISQKSMYFDQMGIVRSLEDNWRSAPEIVNFNNHFFEFLKNELPENSKNFYNSIHQNAKSSLRGYVHIFSQLSEKKKSAIDLVPEIISRIKECEADGFQRGDICILSDQNKDANSWAIELTKAGYKIVSAESLLVNNEIKVKLIISYLKRRLNPSGKSEKKKFAELFFRINKENSFELYRNYFHQSENQKGQTFTYFNDDQFIIDQFGGKTNFFSKYENLYDLTQSFFRLMNWDELKNPYLHHFADFVHEFELAKGPDIKSFLSHYNDQKSKLAIQLPESNDAIKIMTIHKSKGLEFPVVIIPSLDFTLTPRTNNKFLFEVDETILYTTLSKDSPVAGIKEFKFEETAQTLTDKVNLAYVALTRPMERLYIMNHYSKSEFGLMAHLIFTKMDNIEQTEEGGMIYSVGEKSKHILKPHEVEFSFFQPQSSPETLWFPDISLQDHPDLLHSGNLSKEQSFGTQFHLAMSEINNPSEVELIISQLIKEGRIDSEFEKEFNTKISAIFDSVSFQELFENANEVLNEQSIIIDEKNTQRPDKIILKETETILLDYKTGIPTQKDVKQMLTYKLILEQMGLPDVKAKIFYTATNELRSV